jgi:hypothetical protein
MQSACLECHAAIASSLDAKQGLHGVLAATDCARCHTEHHGADVELSGARAFAQAGIPDRAAYDHAALGFTLEGAHVELACVRCHVALADPAFRCPRCNAWDAVKRSDPRAP